jgi:hypothetical protein
MALWKDSNPIPASNPSPGAAIPPAKDSFAPPDRANVAPLNPQSARK